MQSIARGICGARCRLGPTGGIAGPCGRPLSRSRVSRAGRGFPRRGAFPRVSKCAMSGTHSRRRQIWLTTTPKNRAQVTARDDVSGGEDSAGYGDNRSTAGSSGSGWRCQRIGNTACIARGMDMNQSTYWPATHSEVVRGHVLLLDVLLPFTDRDSQPGDEAHRESCTSFPLGRALFPLDDSSPARSCIYTHSC